MEFQKKSLVRFMEKELLEESLIKFLVESLVNFGGFSDKIFSELLVEFLTKSFAISLEITRKKTL